MSSKHDNIRHLETSSDAVSFSANPTELANKFKEAFAARKAGVKPPISSFGGMGMKKGGKAKSLLNKLLP